MENKEKLTQIFAEDKQIKQKDFEVFFEDFFEYMQTSKDADIISAREYIAKSVDPKKTEHKSIKGFLKEIFFKLYSKERLVGYNLEFMQYSSIEKTGLKKKDLFCQRI